MPTEALKEENPAVQEIADLLAREFNKVESKIKGDLKAAYRREAEQGFEGLMEASRNQKNVGIIPLRGWYQYAAFDMEKADRAWRKQWEKNGELPAEAFKEAPPRNLQTWEQTRRWAEFMRVDYHHADQSAEDAFDDARDSFIRKNVDKVRDVLKARTEIAKSIVRFGFYRRVFTGSIEVQLKDASFEGEIGLKYVIRTIPRVTPYFQYPLNFTTATVSGKTHARPSQEQLRILLGGGSDKDVKIAAAKRFLEQGFCSMGGEPVPAGTRHGLRYVACPACKSVVSAQHGKFRKHKTKVAEKLSVAQKLQSEGYCPKSREKVSPEVVAGMGAVEPYKDPKVACEHCGQLARLDAEKDWIPEPEGYPKFMKVKSAKYYKHKIAK